ncbi:VOC family protein [Cellulomonas sp. NPDC057328]|uniref:VOC family protein n=1 Tax=Cellulomonas sp. NPDC057328 TaxID=3346101 RepID=UPI00363DE4CD
MHVQQIGAAYAVPDPTDAGAWFTEHLGFRVLVDLGWYVSMQHPDRDELRVDLVRTDHETWPTAPDAVAGAMLALVVDDVDAAHARMASAGVTVLKALVTEPWGQRRFQAAGPGGLLVELVQPVPADPAWMAAQGLTG